MDDPINGCTENNLQDPSILPPLQCTLQCMGHAQKCVVYAKSVATRWWINKEYLGTEDVETDHKQIKLLLYIQT